MFLHTTPCELTYNFSIPKIYSIEVQVQKVLNSWSIVHMDSLELRGAESIPSTDEQM